MTFKNSRESSRRSRQTAAEALAEISELVSGDQKGSSSLSTSPPAATPPTHSSLYGIIVLSAGPLSPRRETEAGL